MTTRPGARRRSALAGQSAITPPAVAEAEATPSAPPAAATPEAAPVSSDPAPQPAQPPAKPVKKKAPPKMAWYHDPDIVDRSRTAYRFTQGHEGFNSWSDLVNRALDEYVRKLESKYNNGEEFPKTPPGAIPRGRPVG